MGHSFKSVAVPSVLASLLLAVLALTQPSQASSTNPGAIDKAPIVWLDASDPDGDGNASNNPADGAPITVWRDKSGNGNDAELLDGWNAATYQVGANEAFNDEPSLQFDRVSDFLGTGFSVPVDGRASATPSLTVFAVYLPTANSANNGVWGMDNGDWDRFFLAYHPGFGDGVDDGAVATGPYTVGVTVTDAGLVGTPRLSAVRYAGNVVDGANVGVPNGSAVFFDGDLVTRFTDNTDLSDAQSNLRIGLDGDNSVFQGEIAEVLVYPYALTDEEILAVSTYIHDTYDVAKTPVAISAADQTLYEGASVGELGFTTVPATSSADWETAPVCHAFALADTDFSNPLTGALPKGRYQTQCSGGLSDEYATSVYTVGILRVLSRFALDRATVYFEPYSADLSPAAKRALRALVNRASDVQVAEVTIKGYVRPTAVTSNDASLSRARARSVANYLRSLGVDVEMDARGMGVASHRGATARKAVTWLRLDRNPDR